MTPTPPPPGETATTLPAPGTSTPPSGGTGGNPTATTSAPVPPRVSTTARGGDSQPWLVVIAILVAILAAVAIYVSVVIGAKSHRRARRRDAAEPAVSVQGAWDEALDKLREAHVAPDPALTPLELARSAPRRGVTGAGAGRLWGGGGGVGGGGGCSGDEHDGAQVGERGDELFGPGPACGEVQRRCSRGAGETAGQVEVAAAQRLVGDELFAETDAGDPARQVVGDDVEAEPRGVGAEPARREMVQPDAVLEVADRVLDLGVAAVVGFEFER